MLTKEDKEEIKRLIVEVVAESGPPFVRGHEHADDIDRVDRALNFVTQMRELIVNGGFTELTLKNPKTGEEQVLKATLGSDPIVDVAARAIEVFGTREKALRWLKTPVRSLGDQTPLSLLNSPEGVARVQDTLGRVEHGVW